MFDKYGSDAMRWFLMSSPILRGGNLIVTADGIRDTVRQVMLPVWSSYYFFTLYANAANGGAGFDARQLRADEVADLPLGIAAKIDVGGRVKFKIAHGKNLQL